MTTPAGQDLTERQQLILGLVIEDFVAEGHPVASKALTEHPGMAVSSSTVRYELAELEELGLLTHPHTSAGRVPTELGYRTYVNRLLSTLEPRPAALPFDLSSARSEIDAALKETTEALAETTHLLALVTAPPLESTVVRHVEVVQLQPQVVVVVVITSTGGVSKRIFVFDEPVDPMLASWAADYLNESLGGLKLGVRLIRSALEAKELSARERGFLDAVRPAFAELVESGDQEVYVGGAAGLLDEFRAADLATYRGLLETLERRAALLDLMRSTLDSKRPFARVGSELEDPALANAALVGAPYGLARRNLGTVSLVGPTRMDYGKAIDSVRAAANELSRFVEELYED